MVETNPLVVAWPEPPGAREGWTCQLEWSAQFPVRFRALVARSSDRLGAFLGLRIGLENQLLGPLPFVAVESPWTWAELVGSSDENALPHAPVEDRAIRIGAPAEQMVHLPAMQPGVILRLTVRGRFDWLALAGDRVP